ncbi:hypothetical protein [Acidaminococcus timonensis]|uniref:hypothetical protein n=1 Tax=Acidaminococcus timonensis TaxID=1871002 RepID=UPI00307801B1
MKGKDVRRQLACLCLMAFLTGLPVLAGASGGKEIYGRKLDTLYDMIQEPQTNLMGKVEKQSWQSLTQVSEFGEPMLAVTPRERLEDVHLLTLQVAEVSDSGQVTWQVEKDEPLGNLEPGSRYNYPMHLEGTARATGLSYYDRKGYHRKILQISGKDGSLVVREE